MVGKLNKPHPRPGLRPLLQLLGAVLVVVPVALAIQGLIYGFAGLGLIVKA